MRSVNNFGRCLHDLYVKLADSWKKKEVELEQKSRPTLSFPVDFGFNCLYDQSDFF